MSQEGPKGGPRAGSAFTAWGPEAFALLLSPRGGTGVYLRGYPGIRDTLGPRGPYTYGAPGALVCPLGGTYMPYRASRGAPGASIGPIGGHIVVYIYGIRVIGPGGIGGYPYGIHVWGTPQGDTYMGGIDGPLGGASIGPTGYRGTP